MPPPAPCAPVGARCPSPHPDSCPTCCPPGSTRPGALSVLSPLCLNLAARRLCEWSLWIRTFTWSATSVRSVSLWPPGLGGGTLPTDWPGGGRGQSGDRCSFESDQWQYPSLRSPDASITAGNGGWGFCGVTQLWINQEKVLTSGREGCLALLCQGWGLRLGRKVRMELRQVGEAPYPLLGWTLWKQLYSLPFLLREA